MFVNTINGIKLVLIVTC